MLYNERFWNILSYCFRYLNFPAKNGQKYTFEKRERSPFHPFHSSRIIVICTKVLFLVGFQPLWYILWWMSICSFCQKNSRCIALDSTSLMHFMVDEYLQFLNINNYSQMARFFLTYSSSFSRLKHLFSLMQFIPKSFMFLMFIQFHSWNTELTDFLKGLHSGCSLKNCDQIFLDGWKFRQKYDWWFWTVTSNECTHAPLEVAVIFFFLLVIKFKNDMTIQGIHFSPILWFQLPYSFKYNVRILFGFFFSKKLRKIAINSAQQLLT